MDELNTPQVDVIDPQVLGQMSFDSLLGQEYKEAQIGFDRAGRVQNYMDTYNEYQYLESGATPNRELVTTHQWDEATDDVNSLGANKYNALTGLTGTIAYRNNNAGALKLEYKGAVLGNTTTVKGRSRAQALKAMKKYYPEATTLDRGGFLVFPDADAGKRAQKALLVRKHKSKTIPQMLGDYAINDGSGKAHNANYASYIYKYGDSNGSELRNKKIGDLSNKEMLHLTTAMGNYESGTN